MDTARVSPLDALAKAYERSVPAHPADDGLFGPRSIVWRVNRDRSLPLAGMRSLMVQALHPLAMAGVAQRYGRPLSSEDADCYVAEMVRFAEIVGVPREDVPTTVQALRGYIESVGLRQATPSARDAIQTVLDPPEIEEDDMRQLWRDLGQVAVGTLPDWAREMYGFQAPPPELMERESVRQLLGALDLAFEGLPGVLEARQRIELRIRATE